MTPPTYRVMDPDPTPNGLTVAESCQAYDPSGFVCTWPRGHDGDHVAGGGGIVCATWFQGSCCPDVTP